MGAAHITAVLGIEAGITLLEIHGADLNVQDDGGATPLLLAVSQGHKNVSVFLSKFIFVVFSGVLEFSKSCIFTKDERL